jgi:hypothetical protein
MAPLVAVLIQQMPQLLAFAREAFAHANPDDPSPTDEAIIAAYQSALASSLAKDQAWLDAHGEAGDGA